ncbi:ectoine/hydroxyectoine ABC transporter permease subunit EhuD [Blastopirellula retiformator]|uniref:Arginine transport system permease protein ArtQ n=1 Tax=Blastopirellula retiformator TaxID=2527970 RepID=A0A5C5VAD9_9BACT|nr:ectoine/hydroxyectoine ABC transporter permease subunit EhuD [Blastopirellula retiformator]TWT34887.1 Arginine transport system permease protein ArtQ [Blastopirellula retiformator]
MWDWDFTWQVMPSIMQGLGVTLLAVAGGMTLAILLGLLWAVFRRSSAAWLSWPTYGVVEFIRSTPLLVQLYLVYYTLAELTGGWLSPLWTGIFVLGVHYSCYTAEVYRAGLNGVPRGQWIAAKALNLSTWQTYRHVVLPQAIPPILPALGNYLISMFKDAPLLSAITVLDILERAKIAGSQSFRYQEPLTIVGIIFLALSLASGAGVAWLKRRTSTSQT